MAANILQLDEKLRKAYVSTVEACHAAGYEFRPNFTLRTPWQQARLWRQSRSSEEIMAELVKLRASKAEYLASVLEGVGSQHGLWATNALPGLSWHNWNPSKAVDSFLLVGEVADWNGGHPGYTALRKFGELQGLTSMAKIHDYGHLQLESKEVPQLYDLCQVNALMLAEWGEDEKAAMCKLAS